MIDYNEGSDQAQGHLRGLCPGGPLKYAIDKDNCIYFQKGKCRACEKFCPTEAINFEDKEETVTLKVGAVILAPGFKPFDPSRFDTYQYAAYPNVVTSMEFERILSATGPFQGHLSRPSDQQGTPKDRLAPVRRIQGYQPVRPPLLLLCLLHVCHQGGGDCQGACGA